MIDTSKHLVIAGTGRAGTSFLVKWLGASGVDIGEGLTWSERADAGYERKLTDENLPTVVKDPWLFAYCDQVDPDIIGELVIPMRNLPEAAASRTAKHGAGLHGYYAMVAGGMIVEINDRDQENVLARGFHNLIYWATSFSIPYRTVIFPRTVNDASYCVEQFESWLPDKSSAFKAHAELARAKDR